MLDTNVVLKSLVTFSGASVPDVEESLHEDPLADATPTISSQNGESDKETLSYNELEQQFMELEQWKKTTRRPGM